MQRIKVMFYADAWNATSGYSKVVRELALRLAKEEKFDVYVQQIVSQEPAFVDRGVKILPSFGQRGTELFLNSVLNNIRVISPHVFIPICDSFLLVRDGIDKIEFGNTVLMPYIPIDSFGVPDLSDQILDKSDHIFVMSEFGKKQLDEEGYTNNSVLYHGVNLDDFIKVNNEEKIKLKKELGFESDDIIFLAIGRNFPRKRPLRLIEAIAIWKNKYDNDKVKFLLHISDHDKDPYDLIMFVKRMEKRYNVKLEDNIIFTKKHVLGKGLKEEEFLKLFKVSDYYITATSGEGFGIPTIEAMAAKLPVIIPDNSTAPELTGNGEWAYLVENEGFQNTGFGTQQPLVDINALADTIQKVIVVDNTELINKAYNFVKEKCNWDLISIQMMRQIENEFR